MNAFLSFQMNNTERRVFVCVSVCVRESAKRNEYDTR